MPQPDQGALSEVECHHPVVWRCIDVLAQDAASVPLRLFRGNPRDPGAEINSHHVLDLLDRPSPSMTPTVFWQHIYADTCSEGNWFGFVYKDKQSRPESFERLLPKDVTPVPGKTGARAGFYWAPTGEKLWPADFLEVVQNRNPRGSYRGMGALPRLRMLLHLDRVMQDWNWSRYSQGIPTQYIIFYNGMFRPGEREQVETLLRQKIGGPSGDNFMLIDQNAEGDKAFDIKDFPRPSEEELGFLDSEQRIAYRIALAFGVPPSKLQDFSQSTRIANSEAMERLYWEDTIRALHVLVEGWLNSQFLPMYYGGERMFFRFDYSEIRALQQSAKEKADIHALYVDRGVMTRNEARIAAGLEPLPLPLMDEPTQAGKPLEVAAAPPPEPTPPGDGEDPEDDPEDEGEDGDAEKRAKQNGHRKQQKVGDLFDLNAERETLRRAVARKIAGMVKEAGEQALEHHGVAGVFDIKSPEVIGFTQRQIVSLVEEVVTNTNEMVRAAVALATEDGKSVVAMREDVQSAFVKRREPWQLDRIARTEVHYAQEGGGFLATRQNGVERKAWLTAQDSRVRGLELADDSDHDGIEAAGPVPIGDPFVDPRSGAEMMFPGDRSGSKVSGSDTINCRCTMVADFGHLDLSAGRARTKQVWEAKNKQREVWERDLARTIKSYMLGLEQRALERYDQVTAFSGSPVEV